MRIIDFGGLIAMGLLLVGCAGGESPPAADQVGSGSSLTDSEAIEARMDSLRAEIRERVGTRAADEVDSCRALPFGDKPCGGPRTHLVFSTHVTDSSALERLVREYNRLDAQMNELEGKASDCMVVTAPSLTLEDGICTAAR